MAKQFCVVAILLSVILHFEFAFSQVNGANDSNVVKQKKVRTHKVLKAFVAPVALTTVGLLAKTDNFFLSDQKVYEKRNESYPDFHTHADDYLQYVPIIAVYGLNAAGVKGKNNFGNRTALLIKSELIMTVLTYSLKKIAVVPRPDTGDPTSFPSGHTAQAFAAATFMAKEYGHKSVWYSIGAYSVATSVGVLRVMNNRHWASDVFVGAGIGILSTNIAYLTHQYKWGGKKNNTVIVPSYSNKAGGIYFSHAFH
jgi:hypothetical protein